MSTHNSLENLRRIDEEYGTETVRTYGHIVEVAPHLEAVPVLLDKIKPTQFHWNAEGLASSPVTINPEQTWRRAEKPRHTQSERYQRFAAFFAERGIDFTPAIQLAQVALPHEFGHAQDFHTLIQEYGGNAKLAQSYAKERNKSELRSLPLAQPTSVLEKLYDTEPGFRAAVASRGLEGEDWEEALLNNQNTYGNLPSERIADAFAMGIIASMHEVEHPTLS